MQNTSQWSKKETHKSQLRTEGGSHRRVVTSQPRTAGATPTTGLKLYFFRLFMRRVNWGLKKLVLH